MPVSSQRKQVGVGPHVGAVVRAKDRHIADDLDGPLVGIGFDRLPLRERDKLQYAMDGDLLGQSFLPAGDGAGTAQGDLGVPLGPGGAVVVCLDRQKQRQVVQPVRVLPAKALERSALFARGMCGKMERSFSEQRCLEGDRRAIVHSMRWERGGVVEVLRIQVPILNQFLQADQQGIQAKSG